MKLPASFLLLEIVCSTCLAQNLSFDFGTHFQRPDLDVRWNAPSNALPGVLWVYRVLPAEFSPTVISNLMAMGSFSVKDKTNYGRDGIILENSDKSRMLFISLPLGAIRYEDRKATHLSPTNLAVDLPDTNQTLKLTALLLQKMGIKMSEIEKKPNSEEPRIIFFMAETTFYVSNTFITNVPFRGVRFKRALDGAELTGLGKGGDCQIEFGSHGEIWGLDVSWRDFAREKPYQTATPETIVKWMREGKAVQNIIFTNVDSINRATVKNVTVHNAYPAYLGRSPPVSRTLVYPYVALDTTVDTGDRKINVELDCPIIDETKPLKPDQVPKPNPP